MPNKSGKESRIAAALTNAINNSIVKKHFLIAALLRNKGDVAMLVLFSFSTWRAAHADGSWLSVLAPALGVVLSVTRLAYAWWAVSRGLDPND